MPQLKQYDVTNRSTETTIQHTSVRAAPYSAPKQYPIVFARQLLKNWNYMPSFCDIYYIARYSFYKKVSEITPPAQKMAEI